jgi:glucan phosphoethanolaminetransferase (alkaline phosphatase superfamily)
LVNRLETQELKIYSNKYVDAWMIIFLVFMTFLGIYVIIIAWKKTDLIPLIIGVLMNIFMIYLSGSFLRRLFSAKPLFIMSAQGIQVYLRVFPCKSSIQWKEICLAGFIRINKIQQVLFYNGQGKQVFKIVVPVRHINEVKQYIEKQEIDIRSVE